MREEGGEEREEILLRKEGATQNFPSFCQEIASLLFLHQGIQEDRSRYEAQKQLSKKKSATLIFFLFLQ